MHLTAAIAAADTDAALQQAAAVRELATLVEYRLDLMGDFDLPRLIHQSPLPAIITCRPPQQGGSFIGPEKERLAILQQAVQLQAPFVDVEIASLAAIRAGVSSPTRIVGSWHDLTGMLGDWNAWGVRARALGADVVKLVGTAQSEDDVLLPLAWLWHVQQPAIGLAMGGNGVISRLLAPRFAKAFLSFGAVREGTAAGQISVVDMVRRYRYHELATARPLVVVLDPNAHSLAWPTAYEAELSAHLSRDMHPLMLPLPCQRLGPGVWLSLVLAGVNGVVLGSDIEIDPAVRAFGPLQAGGSYRVEHYTAIMVSSELATASQWQFAP